MIRRPPRSTLSSSSAASDVYKRQVVKNRYLIVLTINYSYNFTNFYLGYSSICSISNSYNFTNFLLLSVPFYSNQIKPFNSFKASNHIQSFYKNSHEKT